MKSTLQGAELSFHAARVDIPIGRIGARMANDAPGQRLERPSIGAPKVSDELEIAAVRDLALREILRHAKSGRAKVHLKLPPRSIRVGPVSIDVREGTEALIDLEVRDGVILRESTRGTIEPPISLPLGMTFRGLYLSDDGDVKADIAGFPDINLSQLTLRVPRIPATLEEVVALVFDESERKRAAQDEASAFDPSGLFVEARDVVPRVEAFSLGEAGFVVLGPETRLDVDFGGDRLAVRGRVQLVDAELRGVGFEVRGLAGTGAVAWELLGIEALRHMRLDLSCFDARAEQASLRLKDGSRLELGPSSLGRSTAELVRDEATQRFSAVLGDLEGALTSGLLVGHVGERETHVELVRPAQVAGSVRISDDHVGADLRVEGAEVACREVALHLGVADLFLSAVRATATGEVKAGTDFGVAFTGQLGVHAAVQGGYAHLGELHAQLDEGSEAVLHATQVAATEEGLEVLVGDGELKLRFRSGQLPLGPKAAVSFSRGATGGITLTSIELGPGERWPRVQGQGHVEAASDPVVLGALAELPGGRASVDGRFALDSEGHLAITDLSMSLRSEDGEA